MHIKLDLRFPVPTEKLPKTTPAELAGQLDETIQTISKNDTGIVIAMGDKPNVLLCPAAWFNFCFDDDFGCIINSAVRYSIGRETYMPSTVASYVRNYMDVLDRKTINVMLEDIDDALKDEHLAQRSLWVHLKNDLLAHLKNEP